MINENSKVLIVDDFETVRMFLRNALGQLEMTNIEEAANGREALELLQTRHAEGKPFDLVFCDWNMPEMTGLELLQTVRKHDLLSKIPFVMVTAESETHAVINAVNSGVTDYISKPFSLATLQRKLQTIKDRVAKAS